MTDMTDAECCYLVDLPQTAFDPNYRTPACAKKRNKSTMFVCRIKALSDSQVNKQHK